jgi:hypothetical protein
VTKEAIREKNCHPSMDGWQQISAKRFVLGKLLRDQSHAFAATASTKTDFDFFLLAPRKKIPP